jgi:hypothetical protein
MGKQKEDAKLVQAVKVPMPARLRAKAASVTSLENIEAMFLSTSPPTNHNPTRSNLMPGGLQCYYHPYIPTRCATRVKLTLQWAY